MGRRHVLRLILHLSVCCSCFLVLYFRVEFRHVEEEKEISSIHTARKFTTTVPSVTTQKELTGAEKLKAQPWPLLTKSNITASGVIFPANASPPISVSYIIPNAMACSRFLSLTYVVIVHSAPTYLERRRSMRGTWANQTLFKRAKSRVIFLLGKPKEENIQTSIEKENAEYGDIVQGDFIDDYKNLTLKAVMGLRWITEKCRNAKFVIKVDDDVFIDMFIARNQVFPILSLSSNVILCSAEPHAHFFRTDSPNKHVVKWMISYDYFENLHYYPMPFCYGYATFFPLSMAIKFYDMSKSTPFFRLDDVYVYGIIASKLRDTVWCNANVVYFKEETATIKAMEGGKTVLVGTAKSAETMQKLWKISKEKSKTTLKFYHSTNRKTRN